MRVVKGVDSAYLKAETWKMSRFIKERFCKIAEFSNGSEAEIAALTGQSPL